MLKPPTHNSTAPAIFVSGLDDAWDEERLERELEAVKARLQEWEAAEEESRGPRPQGFEDHPVSIYRRGDTRYDISAPMRWEGEIVRVSDYLTGTPTKFVLRQLAPNVYAEIQDRLVSLGPDESTSQWNQIMLKCCMHGLAHVEGLDLHMRRGMVTEVGVRELLDIGGWGLVTAIGHAAFRYSQPLSAAEKKA